MNFLHGPHGLFTGVSTSNFCPWHLYFAVVSPGKNRPENDWNLLVSEKVVGSPVPSPAAYGNPPVPSGRIPPAPGQFRLLWEISDSDCVVLMFLSYSQGLTKALNWDYSISHDTY